MDSSTRVTWKVTDEATGARGAMNDSGPASLEVRWRRAASDVINAQQDYVALERLDDVSPVAWREAWLRLWNAERVLRNIDYALQHEVPGFAAAPVPDGDARLAAGA
jgi:hypothetical protein